MNHKKLETNLAGIYTKIPDPDTMIERTGHKAIINRRHAEGNNPATTYFKYRQYGNLKKDIKRTKKKNNIDSYVVLCHAYQVC